VKIGIVRNPVAGSAAARTLWPRLLAALQRQVSETTILETRGAGDAARHARSLCDGVADLVIAVGGDGTIGETVDGILTSSRPETAFSFLAQGTGADFARNFSPAGDPEAMVEALLAAPVRAIDVGLMHCRGEDGAPVERHFANIASFGVPGPIVRSVNMAKRGRSMPGSLRFLYHSAREILRYRPEGVRLTLDGKIAFEGPITAIAVCNGAWFGGGMHVAPDAVLDDGLFDVVLLGGAPTLNVFGLLNKLYSGAHIRDPLVHVFRARTVEAEPLGGRAALMDCDGEAPGSLPARFECLPGRLRLKSL